MVQVKPPRTRPNRPPNFDYDYKKREYHLVSIPASTEIEHRHVYGYEDDEGWHGRLTSESESALEVTWPKGCWRSV